MNDLAPVIGVAAAAWIVSYWLTGGFRRYALDRRILDIPNARSLHSQSTPRGGGMAIVLTTLAGLACLGVIGAVPWREVVGLVGAGALVAGVGFADDHRPIRRRWRLLAHVAAAGIVLVSIARQPALPAVGGMAVPAAAGIVIALLYVVWLINLTNFMDGIDGMAAVEAITVSAGGVLLYVLGAPDTSAWAAPLLLAAASAGFLAWNWPPARIFMGDGGSGFLGLTMAALSLAAGATAPSLFWGWLVLLGVFIVDATLTLCRRMLRGERVHEPHRTHAYQHAALRAGRHRPVTLAVASINLVWLLPIAVLATLGTLPGAAAVAIAYAPLLYGAWHLRAGMPQRSRPVGEAIV